LHTPLPARLAGWHGACPYIGREAGDETLRETTVQKYKEGDTAKKKKHQLTLFP